MSEFVQEKATAASEKERAIRLIRKLDARTQTNGCTESEAMEAAEKIGQLMSQFDIELTEVIISEEKCIQREVYAADESIGRVIVGVGKLCSLVVYHKNNTSPVTFVMFGMERDVELAVFLFEICSEAADLGWAQFIAAGHGWTKKQRESFRVGFSDRVCDRMQDIKAKRDQEREARMRAAPGSRDLVLVRDGVVREEFEKTGVRLTSGGRTTVHNRSAYNAGQAHGANVNLNSPLGGPGAQGAIR